MNQRRTEERIRRNLLGCFLAGAMAISSIPLTTAAAAENTVYVSNDGLSGASGTDERNPVDSIYEAGKLLPEGGTIVVTDTLFINGETNYTLNDKITIKALETLEGPLFQVEKGGRLTLNNIVINGNSSSLIFNQGTVRVEGDVSFLKDGEILSVAAAVETGKEGGTFRGDILIEGVENCGQEKQTGENESKQGETGQSESIGQEEENKKQGDGDNDYRESGEEEIKEDASEGMSQSEGGRESEQSGNVKADGLESEQSGNVKADGLESEQSGNVKADGLESEQSEHAKEDGRESEQSQTYKEVSSQESDQSESVEEEADRGPARSENNRESSQESHGEESGGKQQPQAELAAGIEASYVQRTGRSAAFETAQESDKIRTLEERIAALKVMSREDLPSVIEATKEYELLTQKEQDQLSRASKEQLASAQSRACQYNHTSQQVSVTGNIPWYAQLQVIRLELDKKEEGGLQILEPYELKLWNLMTDEAYILPEGESAVVSMPIPDVEVQGELTVFHYLPDGSVETLIPVIEGTDMRFETSSFSPFSVAGSTVIAGIGVDAGVGLSSPSTGSSAGSDTMAGIAADIGYKKAESRESDSAEAAESETPAQVETGTESLETKVGSAERTALAAFTRDETAPLPLLVMGAGSGLAFLYMAKRTKKGRKSA